MSHDAPKVSAQYTYGPTTLHADRAMIHHGGATNAHATSKIRYSAVWFRPVVPRHSPHAEFLINRDESDWITTMSGCDRELNVHFLLYWFTLVSRCTHYTLYQPSHIILLRKYVYQSGSH